ncbi:MAG: hypothetical protein QN718_09810 [Nitrososphaeraceae archaeon]|nr:hypothetical protein [Nitrososphaeraceae archaeon]MDW0294350.1 hypothetical protein [Nitrososphaeraceae archaeon]
MSTSDKEIEFNLPETTHEVDLKTGEMREERKCGHCREGESQSMFSAWLFLC